MLCLVTQSCLTFCNPMDCSPPGSSIHGYSPGKNTGGGCHVLLHGDLPDPEIKPRSPTLQVDSLPSEPTGKPTNTEVSSLSLRQRIFPTQESNQGPLHCRQILYKLSYPGSPGRLQRCRNPILFIYQRLSDTWGLIPANQTPRGLASKNQVNS